MRVLERYDRIAINSALIVACFVGVLLFESQSAASYPTYFLTLWMLFTIRRWDDVLQLPFLWVGVALVAYLVLSAFWSTPYRLEELLSFAVRGLLVTMFVIAFAECQHRGQLQDWLGTALGLAGFVGAIIALVFYLQDVPEDGRLKGMGQLHNPVVAALVFGVAAIFAVDQLRASTNLGWRALMAAAVGVMCVVVVLTGSRNAWASLVLGLAVYVLGHFVRDRQRFLVATFTLLLLIGAGLLGLLQSESVREVLLPRGLSHRPDIWSAAFERVWSQAPIFGFGIASDNDVVASGVEYLHPHSMYLSVYFQGGVAALGLLLVLIAGTYIAFLRHYAHPDAKLGLSILTMACSAYLLDGHELVDKVGWNWFLFWLPVALGIGLRWQDQLRID